MGMSASSYYAYGVLISEAYAKDDIQTDEAFENVYSDDIEFAKVGYYDSDHYVVYIKNTLLSVEWDAVPISNIPFSQEQVDKLKRAIRYLEKKINWSDISEAGYYMWPYYG